MEGKVSQVRDYILRQLEDGGIAADSKLDGAREIARTTGICFAKVQQGLDLLARDGVLESVSRKGTFVHKNWQDRILPDNIKIFDTTLPWMGYFKERIDKEIPDLRVCDKCFCKGTFEIKTTWDVEAEQDNFMDMKDIFREVYPDASVFYSHPFKSFYCGNRLIGIPIIFSPRVMFYNAEFLKAHGCENPKQGWTWDDFIDTVKKLRNETAPENIVNWIPQPFFFMNFIFRAGGGLISSNGKKTVLLDHPDTIRGIEIFKELGRILGYMTDSAHENYSEFFKGNAAFNISTRQMIPKMKAGGMKNWNVIHLPLISGGADVTAQATDLLCIRKSCTDMDAALKLVSLVLSEPFQDYLGQIKYGIPVRKSSALKSIDAENPEDSLFIIEAVKASAEYKTDSEEVAQLISDGIRSAILSDTGLEQNMSELASALRTILKIRRHAL